MIMTLLPRSTCCKFAIAFCCIVTAHEVVLADSLPVMDWVHGAKRGTIVKTYDANAEASTLPVCLASIPTNERATRTFAEIDYRHGRTLFREVAELPEGMPRRAGTEVEVYPKDCERGALSRVTRLLKAVE